MVTFTTKCRIFGVREDESEKKFKALMWRQQEVKFTASKYFISCAIALLNAGTSLRACLKHIHKIILCRVFCESVNSYYLTFSSPLRDYNIKRSV